MSRLAVVFPGLLSLVVGLTTAFAAPIECDTRTEGTVAIQEAVSRVRAKPRVVLTRQRTRDLSTNEEKYVATLARGKKIITQVTLTIGADGVVTATRTFGVGFKGVHEVILRNTDGTTEMTADGRRLSVAALAADPPSLVFEDGGAVPTLRVKADVRRMLRKSEKVSALTCPDGLGSLIHPAGGGVFGDECDDCFAKCFLTSYACFAAEIAGCVASVGVTCGVQAVTSFFSQSYTCSGRLVECGKACNAVGNECCRFHCGNACCGRDATAADTVCVGANQEFAGRCCGRDDTCGAKCCGDYGSVCADPRTGLCCDAGEEACGNTCCQGGARCKDPSKNLCCAATADGCGSFCCLPGERCIVPSDDDPDLIVCQACGPDKPGPVCGETCCGAGQVCGFGNECCRPEELCGGECCDAAHCLNGTTCCKNGTQCGSQCCSGFGQTCCNGQCCAGSCVAGICCPDNRACGPTCCGPGNYCANAQTGLCVQCPAGESPCDDSELGGPSCCPTGQSCCVAGCCAPGLQCCEPPGQSSVGCYESFICVR